MGCSSLLCPAASFSPCLDHCPEVQWGRVRLWGYLGVLESVCGGNCNQTWWLWGPCWSMLGSQRPGNLMSPYPMASGRGVILRDQGSGSLLRAFEGYLGSSLLRQGTEGR